MTTKVLRPVLTISAVTAVLIAALAVYAFVTAGTTHADTAFDPAYQTFYCNGMPVNFAATDSTGELNGLGTGCNHSAENLGAGAAANYTTTLDIPSPDANFSSVITFAPPGTTITPSGVSMPPGTKVGGLISTEKLGIGNDTCHTVVNVNFVLYSTALPDPGATAPTGHTTDPRWAALAYPRQNGDDSRFNGWIVAARKEVISVTAVGVVTTAGANGFANGDTIAMGGFTGGASAGNNTWGNSSAPLPQPGSTVSGVSGNSFTLTPNPGITFSAPSGSSAAWAREETPQGGGTAPTNSNGLNALGTAQAITGGYPAYLLDVFSTVPGGGTPVIPQVNYGGLTLVVGSTWTPLYFVQFSSGQAGALNALGGGTHILTSGEGSPSVSVLTDPSSPASPSSITDFCTGSANSLNSLEVTTTLLGTSPAPGSHVRATNPAAGTKFVTSYAASLRDTDNDGIENALDTCPISPTPNAGDPRSGAGNTDTDGDGIDNVCDTTDNVPHGLSTDQDADGFKNRQDECPQVSNTDQADSEIGVIQADNGPESDAMGDACDSSGTVAIKQNATGGAPAVTITLGSTVANGRYILKTSVIAKCFGGGADADADGYCDSTDEPASPAGASSDLARHKAQATSLSSGVNQTGDSDGDGASDGIETYLGTDATHSCSQTGFQSAGVQKANDEGPLDNWIFDIINDDSQASTGDILQYAQVTNGVPFNKEAYGTISGITAGGVVTVTFGTPGYAIGQMIKIAGTGTTWDSSTPYSITAVSGATFTITGSGGVYTGPAPTAQDGTATLISTSGVPLVRFDLNDDGVIDTGDILQFANPEVGSPFTSAPFNKVCGPGTSTATQGGVTWAIGAPMTPGGGVPGFVQQ